MQLNDYITISERAAVSDGAGGKTPGALTELFACHAQVKPMTGMIGMQYQQITGTQGYHVFIRTDFTREIKRDYLITYKGIYSDINMVVESIEIGRNYTKLTCKSEGDS